MARRQGVRLTRLSKFLLVLACLAGLKAISSEAQRRPPRAAKDPADAGHAFNPKSNSADNEASALTEATPDTLVMGTWNLEWFGTPEQRGGLPRSKTSIQAIARLITEEVKVGVLILNEINPRSWEWNTLNALLMKKGYVSVAPLIEVGQQSTVLVYDSTRVKPLGTTAFLPISEHASLTCQSQPRSPVVGSFVAGDFDFTVVGVHFLAQRESGRCGGVLRDAARRYEANTLLDYLTAQQQVKMVDNDIILMGDLNVEPDHPSIRPLLQRSLQFVTIPEQMKPTSGRWSYRKGQYRHALDHILLSNPARRDFVTRSAEYPRRFSELDPTELILFQQQFSDHAPAWAQFQTDLGDDD